MSNDKVFEDIEKEGNIKKSQLKFIGHVMRKMGLESLILTGQIDGKKERGKQSLTYLLSLRKWILEYDLGEMRKKRKKCNKRQKDVDGHDRLRH